MRRFPIEIVIVALCVVIADLGLADLRCGEMGRFAPVIHAQRAPSELYARLTIHYAKPPIDTEEYRMSDIEGVSSFQYSIRGYDGRQITVNAPPARVYDVSFFFGRLVQDGVWDLVNRPSLPDANAHYTVYVKQLADYQNGQRTVTFTDPQYWATKAAGSIPSTSPRACRAICCTCRARKSPIRVTNRSSRIFAILAPTFFATTSPPRRNAFAARTVDRVKRRWLMLRGRRLGIAGRGRL